MKQNLIFLRSVVKILPVAALLLAGLTTSCSEGADCDEVFQSSVHDTQLKSPELSFANKMTTSGSEVIQVSWPVVRGASGYKVSVQNVDDPSNPVVVINDSIVDGTSFTFSKKEDTNYSVSVLTLGNAELRNTDADAPTVVAYSTMVPGQVVPAGTEDVAAWINSHIIDTDEEQAFELEAGATYVLNDAIDFLDKKVTFRGSKVNRPILVLGEKGVVRTSSALNVKFINFDCTNQVPKGSGNGIYGVIEMSPEPPACRENPKETMKNYYLQETILIKDCMFKNLHGSLFAVGNCSWGIEDLRVDNCIVQLDWLEKDYWSNGSIISAYSNFFYKGVQDAYYGGIKDLTIKNSTIYNIQPNATNYFMRWNNKDLKRCIPTELQDGKFSIENCTLSMVMTGKNWGDRTPNTKEYVVCFNNNVVYDTYRLQKIIQGNCTWDVNKGSNTIWGRAVAIDGTDKEKIATEEDPGFTDDQVHKPLDLTQPNGGVNFKATGAISSTVGDPRWLE